MDFDALYRNHYRRVFALCQRLLSSRAQAEEAAQEVFVRAYRARDRYDETQPFAAWVLGIAGNHCVDVLRRRTRESRLFDGEGEAGELTDDASGTLDTLLADERAAAVRDAISGLPDRYRVPLVLAYYNEWSYDDIAAELGITRNHVGVLLLRGRQALRRVLAASNEEGES